MDHASPLKEKLGVVLWQLPPQFEFQKERLERFASFSQPSPVLKVIVMCLSLEINPGSVMKPFAYWRNSNLPFVLPMAQAFL